MHIVWSSDTCKQTKNILNDMNNYVATAQQLNTPTSYRKTS